MDKGQYGYIRRYRRNKWISIIILGVVIIIGVIISLVRFGTTKSIIIVLPILTALPFAKQIVSVILIRNFKPLSTNELEKVKAGINSYSEENVLYDISVSRYEGIRFFPVVMVKDGRMLVYYPDRSKKRVNLTDLKAELMSSFEKEKNPYIIIVTENLDDFIKKANTIKEADETFRAKDKKMIERLFELGV